MYWVEQGGGEEEEEDTYGCVVDEVRGGGVRVVVGVVVVRVVVGVFGNVEARGWDLDA